MPSFFFVSGFAPIHKWLPPRFLKRICIDHICFPMLYSVSRLPHSNCILNSVVVPGLIEPIKTDKWDLLFLIHSLSTSLSFSFFLSSHHTLSLSFFTRIFLLFLAALTSSATFKSYQAFFSRTVTVNITSDRHSDTLFPCAYTCIIVCIHVQQNLMGLTHPKIILLPLQKPMYRRWCWNSGMLIT